MGSESLTLREPPPSSSRPIVNVVAVFLVLLSLLPLYLAQRLMRDGSTAGGRV